MTAARIGRPPLAAGERSVKILVALPESEREQLRAAAKARGLTVSALVRAALTRELAKKRD